MGASANTRQSRLKRPLVNLAVMAVSTLLVVALGEGLFRYRFGPAGYRPRPEVLRIQEYLVAQPDYGFTWRPNISADEGIVFDVADVEYEPLSTDADGFINHPDAVGLESAAIVGLGDSFVEHAAHIWFELFRDAGFSYRNLAMHRTAPPQYAKVFEMHGEDLNPRWIVVGLFENDFSESWDYDKWLRSDLDWFEYHSGTWCGPPIDESLGGRIRESLVPGWTSACRNVRARFRGDSMSILGPNEYEQSLVFGGTIDIVEGANRINARPIVLLIPSKPTATHEYTEVAQAFNDYADRLSVYVEGFDVIDLRDVFRSHESPASLYYAIDGHWNAAGMRLAGETVLRFIQQAEKEGPP